MNSNRIDKKATDKPNKKNSLIKLLCTCIVVFSIAACEEDDEVIVVKDYGLKIFTADYNYSDGSYKDQVYFSFTDSLVFSTSSDSDDWIQFYLYPDAEGYNDTSNVEGWDLVFTNYTTAIDNNGTPYEHAVTGVLINIKENIEVGFIEYTEYDDNDSIANAFVDLSLSDIDTITYTNDIDAIGYDWKSYGHSSGIYAVSTNYFYFVKLDEENIYKLRFTSFYGSSTDERMATIQYQLMQ